jgi:hypothetical protein
MKTEIERATLSLNGKALWRCLRAADMAMFDFGKRRASLDFWGNPREVGDLALHVQCAWRITQDDRVLVGSNDLYYPADYDENNARSPEFDWERDPNRRDKLLASMFENGTKEFLVQKVEVGLAGSLHIALSGNLFLEVFPNDSLTGEHWRLFEPDKKGHFVVTGSGIGS